MTPIEVLLNNDFHLQRRQIPPCWAHVQLQIIISLISYSHGIHIIKFECQSLMYSIKKAQVCLGYDQVTFSLILANGKPQFERHPLVQILCIRNFDNRCQTLCKSKLLQSLFQATEFSQDSVYGSSPVCRALA